MKKLNYFLLGAAGLLLASCSQEDIVSTGADGNVQVTISLPEGVGTRASIGSGEEAVNLQYAIYETSVADGNKTYSLVYNTTIPDFFSAGMSNTLSLDLIKGKQYTVAFFAESANAASVYSFSPETQTLSVKYSEMISAQNNADDYDCFINTWETGVVDASISGRVLLYRPVAQVNWGSSDLSSPLVQKAYGTGGANIWTTLQITNAPQTLNFLTGNLSEEGTVEIGPFAIPTGAGNVQPGFPYVGMQYVLTSKTSSNYDLSLTIANSEESPTESVEIPVNNVPLQANYQTNIYGALLTNSANLTIEVIPAFDGQYNPIWDGKTATTPAIDVAAKKVTLNQPSDLAGLASIVNGETAIEGVAADLAGFTVNLESDVDMNGHSLMIGSAARSGSAANADASKGFAGTFNGNGNTISNLTLTGTSNANDATAFIPWLNGENASVYDVIFENFTINAPANEQVGVVGLLTGGASVSGVTIKSGNIEAFEGAGIVGRMMKSGSISDCENHADITVGQKNGAGIAGAAYYTEVGSVMTISNCKNYGNIKTTGTGTGATTVAGIVGTSAAQVTECVNYGQITGGSASNSYGGIVGAQFSAGSIEECTNYGTVSGCNYVGGIVGKLDYSDDKTAYQRYDVLQVLNNTNYGNVLGGNEFIGGIVGYSRNSSIVSGNTNYAKSITGKSYLAGLVGNAATNISPKVGEGYCTLTNNKTSTTLDQMSPNATPKNEFYNLNNSTQSKIDASGNTLVEAPAE